MPLRVSVNAHPDMSDFKGLCEDFRPRVKALSNKTSVNHRYEAAIAVDATVTLPATPDTVRSSHLMHELPTFSGDITNCREFTLSFYLALLVSPTGVIMSAVAAQIQLYRMLRLGKLCAFTFQEAVTKMLKP